MQPTPEQEEASLYQAKHAADELEEVAERIRTAHRIRGHRHEDAIQAHITAAVAKLREPIGNPFAQDEGDDQDAKPAPEHRQAPPHRSRSRIAGALDNAGTSTDGVTVGRTRRNRST